MADKMTGVVKKTAKGGFVLRDPARSYKRGPAETMVSLRLVRDCGLVEGAPVTGTTQKGRFGPELVTVENICGLSVEQFRRRKPYTDQVAIPPYERFRLEVSGLPDMRMIDLIAPIGKGTRGLIVSPPKAGKTTMLQHMCQAICKDDPKTHVICMLIDERPEEVTMFKRSVDAQVVASSIDQTTEEHIELAETVLAQMRVELECGLNVVILVDSLTRMGRAFNRMGSGTGRMMTGGLEAGSLEIPRRFLGMARKVEGGGSVTIIATALIDTGSKMDQLIFEEFKGTGNSEIVLSRALAEMRVFPAVDIPASGTRMDEQLWGKENGRKLYSLRKALATHKPREAIEAINKIFGKYPTNSEFLRAMPAGV